jgi:hypothetical protein
VNEELLERNGTTWHACGFDVDICKPSWQDVHFLVLHEEQPGRQAKQSPEEESEKPGEQIEHFAPPFGSSPQPALQEQAEEELQTPFRQLHVSRAVCVDAAVAQSPEPETPSLHVELPEQLQAWQEGPKKPGRQVSA